MRKFLVPVSLVLVLISLGWFYIKTSSEGKQPIFRLARVERGPIVSAVSATGTLNAVVTVQVGSQVSGQIKELLADFNSEVRKDQVITLIAPENFEARVRQAEADLVVAIANVEIQRAAVERSRADLHNASAGLAAAKAQTQKAQVALADAKRHLEREEFLFKKSIASKSELDNAQNAYDQAVAQLETNRAQQQAQAFLISSREAMLKMAEAEVEHALAQVKHREAALNQTKVDLEHTIIRSPVDGVVIGRSVDIGQTVAASLQAPTLFTIAQDLRKMQVNACLDEADIGRINVGQRAIFTVDAFPAREFTGSVEQIRKAPQTIQNVVTYTVIVSAQNLDLRLLPGMTANVQIIVDERSDAVKVPNAALRFRPSSDGMKPAGGNQQSQPAAELGGSGTGLTAASNGWKPGERGGPMGEPDRLARLTEALMLSEDQQTQIRAIFAGMREQIAALRQQGAAPDEARPQTQRLREQNREAIMAILTPEQRDKYRQMIAARTSNPVTRGRVWVLGADQKPTAVDVTVGISDGNCTEIIRGELKEGQQVIVGTNQTVRKPSSAGGLGRFGF